ncbi:hypothetical protein RRG08_029559, partial [Elysia crispata]
MPSSVGKIPPNPALMLHNFPAFDDEEDDQPINFSSRDQESQQMPPLTFSTFQKNIHPPPPAPAAHQHQGVGGGFMGSSSNTPSRLLTPRGKSSLPTLVEQSVAENAETESSSGKSEVPVVYAEEGTPPNMSETTSLSGLTMDHLETGQEETYNTSSIIKGLDDLSIESVPSSAVEKGNEEEPSEETAEVTLTSGDQISPASPKTLAAAEGDKQGERDSSMSEVSEGAKGCHAKASEVSPHKRPPQSPAKSSATAKPTGAATVISHHASSVAAARNEDMYADFSRDCLKSYATERHACNLLCCDISERPQYFDAQLKFPRRTKKSSSSLKNPLGDQLAHADTEVAEGRTLEVEAQVMTETVVAKSKISKESATLQLFVPRMSNLRVVAPFHDFVPAANTVKTYNVEGTPRNFSAATSLSDLTIDSIEGPTKAGKATGVRGVSKISKIQPPQASYIPGPFSPPPSDSLHTYNLEGSPLTFSHNASSLSSLGDELEPRGAGSGVSASPHKDNSGSHKMYTHHMNAAGGDQNESDSSSSIPRERHIVGQSSEDSSIAGDSSHITSSQPRGGDQPVKYTVEDTPFLTKGEGPASRASEKQEAAGLGIKRREQNLKPEATSERVSDEEDDLADCDPTPSEQALLDQCINSAMPKSRLPRGDERARRHSRAKFLTQRVTRNTSRPGSREGSHGASVAGSAMMG